MIPGFNIVKKNKSFKVVFTNKFCSIGSFIKNFLIKTYIDFFWAHSANFGSFIQIYILDIYWLKSIIPIIEESVLLYSYK